MKSTLICYLIPTTLTRRSLNTFLCLRTIASLASPLMATSLATEMRLKDPIVLLNSVYGPVDDPQFPLPMPSNEAGICFDGRQRRYLWTDAFGVLAYTSIAEVHQREGNVQEAKKYRQAANILIDTVHRCLGSPRSEKIEDAMLPDSSSLSPTGFVGLRIGKVYSKQKTDFGMTYDGMYFHYIDKWLLALMRSDREEDAIKIAKSVFPYFFEPGPKRDGEFGGIRWKLSVDASPPINSCNGNGANDDTLNACILFSILEEHRTSDKIPSLRREITMLKKSLRGYTPRVSSNDPLGWGLEVLFDQFIEGNPRMNALASTYPNVVNKSHLSLPFRLYGALIGAKIAGKNVVPIEKVDALIELSKSHEFEFLSKNDNEEHSSINQVMLAMCMLCPGSLGRKSSDTLFTLPK